MNVFGVDVLLLSVAFVLALLVSVWFYRERHLDLGNSKILRAIMIGLRFSVLFIIAFLLLDPVVKAVEKKILPPELALLVDNSSSIKYSGVKVDSLQSFLKELRGVSEGVKLTEFYFDEKLKPLDSLKLDGVGTNFRKAFDGLENLYSGKNLEGVILVSDGVVNKGSRNLLLNGLDVPVYSVGVGKSDLRKDVVLKALYHNEQVLLGNSFPVRIEGVANDAQGEELQVELLYDGKKIHQEKIKIRARQSAFVVEKEIKSDSIGLHKIEVICKSLKNEFTLENNSKSSYIKVNSKRKKILLVADVPHPDIGAVKSVFHDDDNYEIVNASFRSCKLNADSVEVVMVFGWPEGKSESVAFLRKIQAYSGGVFYVGSNTIDYKLLKGHDFTVKSSRFRFSDAQVLVNPEFSAFEMSDFENEMLLSYPPLQVPYGEYVMSQKFQTFLFQKINQVGTQFPLLTFKRGSERRCVWLSAEGFWQWKMWESRNSEQGESLVFNSLLKKICNYLIQDRKGGRFTVRHQSIYNSGDRIAFEVKLKTETDELTVKPELKIILEDSAGVSKEFLMNKRTNYYSKDFGDLVAGKYRYVLQGVIDGEKKYKHGEFVVEEFDLEKNNLVADHEYLKVISASSGGAFYKVENIDELVKEIKGMDYPNMSYFNNFVESFIDYHWLMLLLLFMLIVEWWIRKWYGNA